MSFILNAAKYYAALPHQDAAWEYLWASLDEYTQDCFMDAYRDAPEAPEAPEGLITLDIFEQLTGYSASLFKQSEADDCNKLLAVTGFDQDIEATCMLMANILHETCNLKFLKELADGWAYEYRSDLGNDQPGDGPKYKGAGVLQLTGKHNYSRLSAAIGDPRVMEGVDYVAETYPFRSAETWIHENRLLECAQQKGFDAVCRRINGGWNGYEDRLAKYEICRRVLR
jgi:putative chitinase